MSLHDTATPTLLVHDPRALVVRGVGYCRQQPDELLQPRITRQCFDAAGRLAQSWDPRLSNPNLSTGYDLAGQSLLTDSVDAGWQLTLFNEARLPVLAWDSRGSECHTEYDPLQRVTAIHERSGEGSLQTVERMLYGDADATHNRRGQLLRHDTPASSLSIAGYSLLGLPITQATRVLKSQDAPHWPAELPARDDLLDDETFVTEQTYTSLGESQAQTDAMGNLSLFTYTVAGQTKKVGLRLTGAALEWLVSVISYNASGQVEQETAGNGVITTARYAEENGRLQHLLSEDGAGKRLQDLHYTYDPVGNILRLEDRAQPIRHFNNRKLEPINDYRYDSLYQLVEARGLEVVTPGYGPELPVLQPTPLDPAQLRPYTQTFDYDVAGNLKERHHSNAPTFRMFTSATSNRSLAQRNDGSLPTEADIALGFDANGNQRQLMPGQQMDWDARNQLSRVTQVAREEEPDDDEHYRYDRPGHRLRTVRMAHTPRRTLRSEVLYLPGLELHRDSASGKEHHVISLQAGRNQVRVLHWTSAPPDGLVNDQLRYSLTDHLGSCAVELDHLGRLISQEWYYAFGGTACWVGRNGVEAKYKTIRYSGKKRDATGLYYYGYRYYAPWLQRWVSPDPFLALDGLNLFCMLTNNPIKFVDGGGLMRRLFGLVSSNGPISDSEAIAGRIEHFKLYLVPMIQQRRESDKERALKMAMKMERTTDVKTANDALATAVQGLAEAPLTYNLPSMSVADLQESGMQNVWERGTAEEDSLVFRDGFETGIFNYEHSDSKVVRKYGDRQHKRFNPKLRPLYGALQVVTDSAAGGAKSYGDAAFVLHDESRESVTLLGRDSFDMAASPDNLGTFNNPYPVFFEMDRDMWTALTQGTVGGARRPVEYIEWQSHAPVEWNDMSELVVSDSTVLSQLLSQGGTSRFLVGHSIRAHALN